MNQLIILKTAKLRERINQAFILGFQHKLSISVTKILMRGYYSINEFQLLN